MKFLNIAFYIFSVFISYSAFAGTEKATESGTTLKLPSSHVMAPKHEHNHANGCSHKTVSHADHTDYVHDNHYHSSHDKHYDEHGEVVAAVSEDRSTASEVHSVHKAHNHIHAPKCGHKEVKHDGHSDYIHDGHYHTSHGDHTDDHGVLAFN